MSALHFVESLFALRVNHIEAKENSIHVHRNMRCICVVKSNFDEFYNHILK
jgi:hypothetical protein